MRDRRSVNAGPRGWIVVALLGVAACSTSRPGPRTASGESGEGSPAEEMGGPRSGTEVPPSAPDTGSLPPGGKAHVSVLATPTECGDVQILPEEPYAAQFSKVLDELGGCHSAPGSENSVSVMLDRSGAVQAFEAVKGNTACLKEAVQKVRFPAYSCVTMLLIVSTPAPADR